MKIANKEIKAVIFDLDGVKTIDKTYPYEFPLNTEQEVEFLDHVVVLF